MKLLYAPWRTNYIDDAKDRKGAGCPFCLAFQADTSEDEKNYILIRSEHAVVMLNRYPYNAGHVMVLPRQHVADLSALSDDVRNDVFSLVARMTQVLEGVLECEGLNVGMNLGAAGGGGIPSHLHVHVLPRWKGDTGFITTLNDTKVVSVDMHEVYQKIKSRL